jgi:hypothetical protein
MIQLTDGSIVQFPEGGEPVVKRAKKSGLVIAALAATSNPVSQVLW